MKEPIFAKYLYVSQDNVVHVLMPVVSRTTIGLDNTCNAMYSLQDFFGKGSNSNQKATLKGELLAYKEALERDLSLLEAETLLAQQKQERLTQINVYLDVVTQLEKHPELDCLNSGLPSYPRPLVELMQDRTSSNLYRMVLSPTEQDDHLRCEAVNPIFSVAHRSVARGIVEAVSPLQQALMQAYLPLRYEATDSKSQVIQQAAAQLGPAIPVNFNQLRQVLRQTVKALTDVKVDFTKTNQDEPFTQAELGQWMPDLNPQTSTSQEYIEALLEYCAPDLFNTVVDSPFNTLILAEQWSVATQFLLGITNIYCVAQGKLSPDTNWGQILDSSLDLSKSLAQTLAEAQKAQDGIEKVCLSWINAYAQQLKLKTSLTHDDFKAIKETFALCYAEIKDYPNFDEIFLLYTQKKGNFFIRQGSICTTFAKFACSAIFDLVRHEVAKQTVAAIATCTQPTVPSVVLYLDMRLE